MATTFCPKCGAQNEAGTAFCGQCGNRLSVASPAPQVPEDDEKTISPFTDLPVAPAPEAPVAPEVPVPEVPVPEAPVYTPAPAAPEAPAPEAPAKKPLPLKKILVAAAAVVLLALVLILCFSCGGNGNFVKEEGELRSLSSEDTLYLLSSATGKLTKVEGGNYIKGNLTGDVAVIVGEDELSYFARNKVSKISDEAIDYVMSADGSTVLYTVNDDDEYELFRYADGKSKSVAKDIDPDIFCISPDGSAIGYCKHDDDDCIGYIVIGNGKAQSLGKNKVPFAISDGGKFVYFAKDNESYYVQKGTKEDSRVKLTDSIGDFYLNIDGSQIIFTDDGKTKISVKGKDPVKMTSKSISDVVLPTGTASYYSYIDEVCCTVCGVKSFAGCCIEAGSKLCYVSKKFEANSVADADGFLAEDGKTFIYQDDEDIEMVNVTKKDPESKTLAKDAQLLSVSKDGKSYYYLNDDVEVMYQKVSSKKGTKLIEADEVEDAGFFDDVFFYTVDNELYRTAGGSKAAKVKDVKDDVDSVYATDFIVLVGTEDDDYYYSTDGKKFSKQSID